MKLFRRKPTKVDEAAQIMINFFGGDGHKAYVKYMMEQQAEATWNLKRKERNGQIIERYDYLKYRIEEGLDVSDEQHKEFEFVKFQVEVQKIKR